MYIAVCDDQIEELEKLTALLQAWQSDRRSDVRFQTFRSGGQLLDAARAERFTLYLLDVLMPGMTGMDAAREIRSFDAAADIIFLTTSPGFAYESYGVRAAEYLLKPINAKLLYPVLDKLYLRDQKPQDGLTVKSNGMLVRLPFSQLSYVEVNGKHLFFIWPTALSMRWRPPCASMKGRCWPARSSCGSTGPTSSICSRPKSSPPPGSSPSAAITCPCPVCCTASCKRTIWPCCFPGGTHNMFDLSMQSALDIFCYVLVLIYGLALSADLSTGGYVSRQQKYLLTLLCLLFLLMQGLGLVLLGERAVKQLYPLVTHVPLVLILILFMKKSVGVAIVSTCTAYLCCQPPRWGRIAVEALTQSTLAAELVYILLIPVMYYLLRRFFVAAAYNTMTSSTAALLLFGSLPVTYYIFDYATTIYSDALYSGIQALNEFLPTVLITFYVLFLPAFHLQSQRRADAEMQRSMLEAELEQSQSEMDSLHRLETQTAVYQHDMRHHLNMLDGLLSAGRPDEATAYIKNVQADIEAITPRRFCENHLVNLLCSSFTDKAQRQGAVLTVDASLPNDVAISDTELCSLLSNGLENALHAVADLPADRKQISLYCGVRQNKLLIEIRNPCAGPIAMRDGLPVSDREGHGYGCRSIQAIAQRNGGLCVFSARQGQFLLQIMLPVLET